MLNKTILQKMKDKTCEDQQLREIMTAILQYEDGQIPGRYKNEYEKIIESICKGEK